MIDPRLVQEGGSTSARGSTTQSPGMTPPASYHPFSASETTCRYVRLPHGLLTNTSRCLHPPTKPLGPDRSDMSGTGPDQRSARAAPEPAPGHLLQRRDGAHACSVPPPGTGLSCMCSGPLWMPACGAQVRNIILDCAMELSPKTPVYAALVGEPPAHPAPPATCPPCRMLMSGCMPSQRGRAGVLACADAGRPE